MCEKSAASRVLLLVFSSRGCPTWRRNSSQCWVAQILRHGGTPFWQYWSTRSTRFFLECRMSKKQKAPRPSSITNIIGKWAGKLEEATKLKIHSCFKFATGIASRSPCMLYLLGHFSRPVNLPLQFSSLNSFLEQIRTTDQHTAALSLDMELCFCMANFGTVGFRCPRGFER